MVDASDREHAHEIEPHAVTIMVSSTNQENAEATQMHDDKGGSVPVDAVDILDPAHFAGGMKVSIKPLGHRGGGSEVMSASLNLIVYHAEDASIKSAIFTFIKGVGVACAPYRA
jgi:hypothetical protein